MPGPRSRSRASTSCATARSSGGDIREAPVAGDRPLMPASGWLAIGSVVAALARAERGRGGRGARRRGPRGGGVGRRPPNVAAVAARGRDRRGAARRPAGGRSGAQPPVAAAFPRAAARGSRWSSRSARRATAARSRRCGSRATKTLAWRRRCRAIPRSSPATRVRVDGPIRAPPEGPYGDYLRRTGDRRHAPDAVARGPARQRRISAPPSSDCGGAPTRRSRPRSPSRRPGSARASSSACAIASIATSRRTSRRSGRATSSRSRAGTSRSSRHASPRCAAGFRAGGGRS